jgi:hypothetical protein
LWKMRGSQLRSSLLSPLSSRNDGMSSILGRSWSSLTFLVTVHRRSPRHTIARSLTSAGRWCQRPQWQRYALSEPATRRFLLANLELCMALPVRNRPWWCGGRLNSQHPEAA